MTYKQNITDLWLKDNGFNLRTFNTTNVQVLRAQQAAKILLTEYASKLDREQIDMLHAFQRAASNSKKIDKISRSQCYKVLNIHTKFNRQLFRKHRK